MGMVEQTDNLLIKLSESIEQFKKDTEKEPTLVIVSCEIFAKIMHCLENVKHDSSYSKGILRGVEIRSDGLLENGNIIVTRPSEWDEGLSLPVMLPYIPPFGMLYQKKRKALKEKVKDLLRRRKRK